MSEPTSRATGANSNKRIGMLAAAVTITLGVWLLLESMGVSMPAMARLWPIFVTFGGLASLIDYFAMSKRPSSLGRAVIGLGLSALLFAFTYHYLGPADIFSWLPALPTIAGAAALATWSAQGTSRNAALLVFGVTFLSLGILGFGAQFPWLRDLIPSVQAVWAVLLLVIGGLILWRTFGTAKEG